MSWPLLYNPDKIKATFEIFNVNSFTSMDEVGKVTLELGQIGIYIFYHFLSILV